MPILYAFFWEETEMSSKKSYYRKKANDSSNHNIAKIIVIIIVLAIVAAVIAVFAPRLIHHCDNCDRLFFGTGYYANDATNALSSFHGKDSKILCRDCAETNHSIEILVGKSLEDFRRPLFEDEGDNP